MGAGTSGLQVRKLGVGYGDDLVLDGIDEPLPPGEVTAIIGPNGCGKSTLLRAMARLLKPTCGAVLLDGCDIQQRPTRQLAKELGLLPQAPTVPEGLTVADLVARGRFPHRGWVGRWTAEDDAHVERALAQTGTAELAHRLVDELSGGQRQRAWIALTLAQDTSTLLLDEPTTYLDLAHQVEVLDLVARLNREEGRTVVMVLHDLNDAGRYADHIIALRDGAVAASGPPAEVLREEVVEAVFGLPCRVLEDPETGTPMVVPAAPRRRHSTASPAAPCSSPDPT
jgi:iron complex transport system ATP-binding protein